MSAKKNIAPLIPLQRTRLHEEIVAQLKDKIVSREIAPGEKLPPERDLAESLNVNRSTVREALNKLESMELVEIKHGDGVYVKDYLESGSLELVKQMLFRDGAPDIGIMKNLALLRRILVPEIACQAAMNRTEDDLLELERIVFQSAEMQIDERDWRVHNIITKASGNLLFVVLLNAFTNMLKDHAYLYFDSEENVRRSETFHREIFEAIKEKKPEKARRIMLDVFIYTEEVMLKRINNISEANEAPL
ncbi:MAG: FadR/GntR family transcriptional regulator [bacterium]